MLADRIGEPDRRESALGRVAAAEAAAGFVEPAMALVERLAPTRRAWGLTDIAQRLTDTGRTADAIATADQAQALLEQIPDGFSRVTVRLRLARVLARLGAAEPALALLHAADRDVAGLADPDRRARALVPLAVAARELGRPAWSVELHRRAGDALRAVTGEPARSRLHARLAEALADTGHLDLAEHHLRQISGPAARVRAGCAMAVADPARARVLLAEGGRAHPDHRDRGRPTAGAGASRGHRGHAGRRPRPAGSTRPWPAGRWPSCSPGTPGCSPRRPWLGSTRLRSGGGRLGR